MNVQKKRATWKSQISAMKTEERTRAHEGNGESRMGDPTVNVDATKGGNGGKVKYQTGTPGGEHRPPQSRKQRHAGQAAVME